MCDTPIARITGCVRIMLYILACPCPDQSDTCSRTSLSLQFDIHTCSFQHRKSCSPQTSAGCSLSLVFAFQPSQRQPLRAACVCSFGGCSRCCGRRFCREPSSCFSGTRGPPCRSTWVCGHPPLTGRRRLLASTQTTARGNPPFCSRQSVTLKSSTAWAMSACNTYISPFMSYTSAGVITSTALLSSTSIASGWLPAAGRVDALPPPLSDGRGEDELPPSFVRRGSLRIRRVHIHTLSAGAQMQLTDVGVCSMVLCLSCGYS